LRQGGAVDEILAHAKEAGADLIVMGTHGRTGLSHLLMGSVAERVLRTAHCPVLTVKAREEAPESTHGRAA
jgi:nucleotide-binding universal stress UspA family protein